MKIDYRITGAGSFATLADDSLGQKISAYRPSLRAAPQVESLAITTGGTLATFIQARAGQVTLSFAVDEQHASADDAAAFLQARTATFAVASNFDLKMTVGASAVQMLNCAITQLDPDEHSDQHTFIRYSFTGNSYIQV
jgi:hypothetical protein